MATADKQVRAAEVALGIESSYPEVSFSLVDCDPGQPRQDFNEADIADLAKNIKANSLLQAVTLRRNPRVSGRYLIVAGERRFRAMNVAGMTKAVFKLIEGPGVGRSYILSAIENLHRVNLNPIEEALSYQKLHDEENLTWEEIHDLTGRDIAVILNKVKLLTFPPEIQAMVRRGDLPQVTALNLSQWRNEQGEYLRMAHDLIAGRDPAEIHFRKDTVLSQIHVQARLPKTPEDFASRIVKLSGRVQSMPAVLEAFLKLPPGEQTKVLGAIHSSVFGKLRVRFVALYRAIQAVSEKMNEFEVNRTRRGEVVESSEPEPVPVLPAPTPVPVAAVVDIRSSRPQVREVVKPVAAAPPPPVAPKPAPSSGLPKEQTIELSYQVLSAMFYCRGQRWVNFSRQYLQEVVPDVDDLDVAVSRALRHAKDHWKIAPEGPEAKQKFIRLMHRFRHNYGNCQRFEDSLEVAHREDDSEDPVSLHFSKK